MRVAIIAPNYISGKTGNAVTVRRIERHLTLLGCEVRVFAVEQLTAEKLLAAVKEFSPQLLHAFHGYLGGRMALAVSQALSIPYLVTITGTDVYQALTDLRSHETHLALRGAAAVVAFHSSIKRRLADHLPTLEERTVVIPQGVDLSGEPAAGAQPSGPGETFTFLFPAGLRPVKNIEFPLQPLASLHDRYPQVRLQLVGPVLDTIYAAQVLDGMEQYGFAAYLGAVSHEAMGDLYRAADVVLNCSLFEGGMANTVLEGLAHGKAILASDIEGNRSVIKEGGTGLLYHDASDFSAKAEHLLTDHHLREKLGRNGQALIREKHSPEKEACAYLQLYQEILDHHS